MEKTARGLEIVKSADSTVRGCKVILTRKTNKAGEIRHGVVLETRRGGHRRVGTPVRASPGNDLPGLMMAGHKRQATSGGFDYGTHYK